MKYVLAIQTAEGPNSLALLDEKGKLIDERIIETREGTEKIILDLTKDLLAKNKVELGMVEKIAVCLGPGSYTGLRVGTAFAKGLAQFREMKIIGIDAFEVLKSVAGEDGTILFDAKNERVYYKIKNEIKVDYLEEALSDLKIENGKEFFGSGAVVNEAYLDNKFGKDVVSDKDENHKLTAALVGKVAIEKGKAVSVEKFVPIYVQEARITESKKK